MTFALTDKSQSTTNFSLPCACSRGLGGGGGVGGKGDMPKDPPKTFASQLAVKPSLNKVRKCPATPLILISMLLLFTTRLQIRSKEDKKKEHH